MRGRVLGVVAVVALVASGCAWESQITRPTATGAGTATRPAVSANGRYIAYASSSDTTKPGLAGGIYRYDTLNDTRALVSVGVGGANPDDTSDNPSISADGRYVAFDSDAENLVTNDDNFTTDVFVRDMVAGTTTRVSVSPITGQVDDPSYSPVISADGRYVAFISESDDFVASDDNGDSDAIWIDRQTGAAQLASFAGGAQPDFGISEIAMSGNGQFVAFTTDTDLVVADENFDDDVYVRDMINKTSKRVSKPRSGNPEYGGGWSPSINYDGRWIAYVAVDDADTVNDPYIGPDIYVRDMNATNLVYRASVSPAGGPLNGYSYDPVLSSNGRRVAFMSNGPATADPNGSIWDVYVRDLDLNRTFQVSTEMFLGPSSGDSRQAALSGDGLYAAFVSDGRLTFTDGNSVSDAYVRVVDVPEVTSISPTSAARNATVSVTINGRNFLTGATVLPDATYDVQSVTRTNETKLTATLKIHADAPTGKVSILVKNVGTGPGANAAGLGRCENCLTIT